jgi:hypothetical protein
LRLRGIVGVGPSAGFSFPFPFAFPVPVKIGFGADGAFGAFARGRDCGKLFHVRPARGGSLSFGDVVAPLETEAMGGRGGD